MIALTKTETRVLEAIRSAQLEERDWSYGTIADELKLARGSVHNAVLQLRLKGRLTEGARRILKVGIVLAPVETDPTAAAQG